MNGPGAGFPGADPMQGMPPMGAPGTDIMAQSHQMALGSTIGMMDQDTQGAIPAAVEPLPADVLYRYYLSWESAKYAEIHEAYQARRYYHGKQWTDEEKRELKRRRQPVVTDNRVKRKVDFLVGVEQRLRRDVKAYPRTPDHENEAWLATAGLRFVQDITHAPQQFSDGTLDGLISGIGVLYQGFEMKQGKVEVCKRHVQADRFWYDPRSEKWDFSDARFLGLHQWMDIDEALELIPQAAEMIDALAGSGIGGSSGMGSVPSDWAKEKNWIDTDRRRIHIIEIHYKHQGQWLYDYLCGSVSLLPKEQTDRMNPYLDENGATTHPYLAWSPYVDENGDRYGVIRDMFSPQDEINKRRSKALHMLSVRQTWAEQGAVKDTDELKRELARPDGHVVVAPGKNFNILDQTAQIQGQFELLQDAKAAIENLGPNPGLAGRGVESQSGRAILAQQNSGMTELSPVFERCREWKLKSFRKDWDLVKQGWTGERWIRVTGQADAPEFLGINQIVETQYGIQLKNDITRIDVDIILEEGPDTITMQEELLEQLSQLGPGVVPPEVLIQLSNIKDKDKVLKMLTDARAPPPELVAMQKRMGDLEAMLKASEVDKNVATSEKTRADVITALLGSGLPVEVIQAALQAFPLSPYYGQPTEVQLMGSALNMDPPMQGAPQQGRPPGSGGPPGAVSGGNPRPAVPGQEPKLNQAGGLPFPSQPQQQAQPPGVPMQ